MTIPSTFTQAETVWGLIDAAAERWSTRRMLVDDHDRDWTFAAYRDACLGVAARLSSQGVGPSTTVSWQLPTTIEAVVLLGALARLGARQNPLIPVLRDAELGPILKDVSPDLIVVPRSWRGYDHKAAAEALAAPIGAQLWVLDLDGDIAALSAEDLDAPLPDLLREGTPRWFYTSSGSTARPKTITHTDVSVTASARAQLSQFELGPKDLFPVSFPIAHIGAMAWLTTSWSAGTQLMLDSAFDPLTSPERMARHRATILGSATPFFLAFLDAQRRHGDEPLFPDLRFCMGGGAPTPAGLHTRVVQELGGLGVFNGYGLTECPILGYPGPGSPPELIEVSAFMPAKGVDVEIRDADGAVLGAEAQGELWARGPQSFTAYLDPELTAELIDEDGFVRTGDLAVLESGHVRISGRIKDVIIRNGENISAIEIETILVQLPSVAEAAVIGLPDARRGESVCAVVVPRDHDAPPALEELVAACESAGLARFKHPEQLHVMPGLPRSPMGKLVKSEILRLVGAPTGTS